MRCTFVLLVLSCCTVAVLADDSVVNPPTGPIQGVVTPFAREFRGVPFGKAGRWEAPASPAPWTTPLDATKDGPGCPQACVLPKKGCPPTTSEDCLLLNVFTPLPGAEERAMNGDRNGGAGGAPVMVFLHGGNCKQGYAGGPLYDGTHLVNTTGVVLVVIQYRLGMLGWLTTNTTMPANLGMQDQIQALRWVQDNIAAFGGDPSAVTVFGQSAGAVSIATLLTVPETKGLYRAAIMESEPFGIPFRRKLASEQWTYDVGTKYAGCPSGRPVDDCLRAMTTEQIIAAQVKAEKDVLDNAHDLFELFWPWGFTIGDAMVTAQPLHAWQAGAVIDVPFIIGTNRDEGTPFIYEAMGKPASRLEYDVLLGVLFGVGNAITIGFEYPVPKNTTDARPTMARATTDGLFACGTRNGTSAVIDAPHTTSKKYIYHFNKVLSFNKFVWGPNYKECYDMVCHAGELPEVFHPNATLVGTQYKPDEQVLSTAMETYWSNMARNLDPGSAVPSAGAAPLTWPAYEPATRLTLNFDTPVTVVKDPKEAFCHVWDGTGYSWLNK
mmetsp:Transcript_9705/g.34110  ORF Transcript_9705/g.34110 Transcript_9705/m.34110 type:complete len:551 (-) Transcript_9705:88-1740(-)